MGSVNSLSAALSTAESGEKNLTQKPSPLSEKKEKMAIIPYRSYFAEILTQQHYVDEVDKDYDFFKYEDKCVDNNYPLDLLRENTKKMEEEDEELKELFEEVFKAKRAAQFTEMA